jgi:hypothetical protein
MIDFGGNPFELLHLLFRWGLGWRYLFSSSFRAKVHVEWRRDSSRLVLVQVILGILLFASVNYVLAHLTVDLLIWLYENKFLVHLKG